MDRGKLNSYLAVLRSQGEIGRASIEQEFKNSMDWLDSALNSLRMVKTGSQNQTILVPKTPLVAKAKTTPSTIISSRRLFYRSDSDEPQISSSTEVKSCPKKIKVDDSEEFGSQEVSSTGPINFPATAVDKTDFQVHSRELIGANTTYPNIGLFRKESIGANSTYVKAGPDHKESIGANSTYVKAGPDHKESIGANSTYVKAGPDHKESIGANSTYVKAGPDHKESIGANSTYVKAGPDHKESIGANGTYVVQQSEIKNEANVSNASSSSSSDNSILEASRIAVEEAMKGPVRLTRTKAKAVAKKAAEQAQEESLIIGNKSTTGESQAALRKARKSLALAKTRVIKKLPDCNPGKVCCNQEHGKVGTDCKKPVVLGRLRCISHTESSSPHHLVNKHLGVSKIQRTLSHNDLKVVKSTNGNKNLASAKVVSKKNGNRLEELAAKTLAVCQRKQEIAKKKSDEKAKKLQDKVDRMASTKAEREKVPLKIKNEPKKLVGNAIMPQKKVVQDDSDKIQFLNTIANQGHTYLAKPLHLRAQDANSAPKIAHPPVKKPVELPINQTFEVASYDISIDPGERMPLPCKNENDYGLDDANSGDSSDDEENPKKSIPKWAVAHERAKELLVQSEISQPAMSTFFGSVKSTPDLEKIFGFVDRRLLSRRSSAVWISPERKVDSVSKTK